jgi:hypothetical protein
MGLGGHTIQPCAEGQGSVLKESVEVSEAPEEGCVARGLEIMLGRGLWKGVGTNGCPNRRRGRNWRSYNYC